MTLAVVPVVDTGVDDALALVVAARHPALRLRGVICTAGNVPLGRVVANTAYVLGLLDARVPMAAGAARRLDGTEFLVRDVHGPDGLAGLRAPAGSAVSTALPTTATLEALVTPDVVVVSLGPLTSVVGLPPRRVVASYARPGAANHDMDPAAAALVAVEHADVVHHPLELPAGPAVTPERSTEVARLVDGLLAHQAGRGAGLGDAAVMLLLAERTLDPAHRERRLRSLAADTPRC
jgi:hypothetical protein